VHFLECHFKVAELKMHLIARARRKEKRKRKREGWKRGASQELDSHAVGNEASFLKKARGDNITRSLTQGRK